MMDKNTKEFISNTVSLTVGSVGVLAGLICLGKIIGGCYQSSLKSEHKYRDTIKEQLPTMMYAEQIYWKNKYEAVSLKHSNGILTCPLCMQERINRRNARR